MQTVPRPSAAAPPEPAAPPADAVGGLQALATLAVVAALALSTWWLFLDPQWGRTGAYGNPANAFIFWTLFAIVCLAFNLEQWGFDRLPQPARGLAFAAASLSAGAAITLLLAHGWGRIDPSFSADRADGAGFFAGAVFVLFAFLTNVPWATTFEHRPWRRVGIAQPWAGLFEIAACALASLALWAVLAAPSVTVWTAAEPLLGVGTLVGLFYCVVVSVIVTGNHTDHRPWAAEGRGPYGWFVARAVGNILAGAALYLALRPLTGALLGTDATRELGPAGTAILPAQLGVWWVFWSIFWANCAGNRPNGLAPGLNRAARAAVTFVLAVVSFAAYYHWAADAVLHEPALAAGTSGNALGFVDWAIVWLLLYAVGGQGWLPARRRQPAGHGESAP